MRENKSQLGAHLGEEGVTPLFAISSVQNWKSTNKFTCVSLMAASMVRFATSREKSTASGVKADASRVKRWSLW